MAVESPGPGFVLSAVEASATVWSLGIKPRLYGPRVRM